MNRLYTNFVRSLAMASIAILTSSVSFANSGESKDIVFTAGQSNASTTLFGQETHTEYRTETRTETCYRTELVGYRTVCTGGYPYPGPYPRPYPPYPYPRQCWQEPVYRQVPYACQRTVQVPYEVVDYNVAANVNVRFGNAPSNVPSSGGTLTFNLNGSNLTISAENSKALFVLLAKEDVQTVVNGQQKTLTGNYTINFQEAAPVLASLANPQASMDSQSFKLELGPLSTSSTLSHSFEAWKLKIGSDIKLFDRVLAANEVEVTPTGSRTMYQVNFDKIGVSLGRGKYSMTMTSAYVPPFRLLNTSDFGDSLSVEKTIIYKIR